MFHSLTPWCTNPRLFAAFFQENLTALKAFCAVLLAIPESRILSCTLRGPAFSSQHLPGFVPPPPSFGVTLTLFDSRTFHLDITLASDSTLARLFSVPGSSLISLLPSVSPLLPSTPFLRLFLIPPPLKTPSLYPPSLYSEYTHHTAPSTIRFVNLSLLFSADSPKMLHVPLYDFSRLLLVRHTRELSALIQAHPWLSPTGHLLEEYLRERELACTWGKHPEGIQAMCSLNRLLLRENRISELREGSRDPAVLARLFQEFHDRGLLLEHF